MLTPNMSLFTAESAWFGTYPVVPGVGGVWNRPGTRPKKLNFVNLWENGDFRPVFEAESEYDIVRSIRHDSALIPWFRG